jgi:type IV pilus assembly protein PilW
MLIGHPNHQKGVSIIELMIGIVVGMLIIAGVTAAYIATMRGSNDTLRSAKLNQALRASMDVMVNDIRRAGYWGTAVAGTNPFTVRGGGSQTDIAILNGGSCILFAYDATHQTGNTAGTVESADFFGFRETSDEVVMRQGNSDGNFTSSCAGTSGWQGFTDSDDVIIDTLTFSFNGSQCLNENTGATWTSTSDTTPACDNTAATGYAAPASGSRLVEIRQVTITLAGHLTADPAFTISLSQPVRVRNDRIITVP